MFPCLVRMLRCLFAPSSQWWGVMLVLASLITACSSAGSGGSSPSLAPTAVATVTEAPLDYIFGQLDSFDAGEPHSYVMDVNTGDITWLDQDDDLYGFLSKQPPLSETTLFWPSGASRYAGIAHLAHRIGLTDSDDSFYQRDPGHFLLWGRASLPPPTPATYDMHVIWHCQFCDAVSGQKAGTLSYEGAGVASFHLHTDEITLTLGLQPPENGRGLILSEVRHFSYQGAPLSHDSAESWGDFFGPDAIQTGLLFRLMPDKGLFHGAAIGQKQPP